MSTKIIFVDDDPMLLASTRRQLRRKLDGCVMEFYEKATDAIEAMKQSPADIVLSDLRMPGMDGAELLTIISQLYPQTIRLAWTGQSEPERLKKVFGIAHQVFSKPCPTQTLIDILNTVVEISRQPEAERLPLLPTAFDERAIACFANTEKKS